MIGHPHKVLFQLLGLIHSEKASGSSRRFGQDHLHIVSNVMFLKVNLKATKRDEKKKYVFNLITYLLTNKPIITHFTVQFTEKEQRRERVPMIPKVYGTSGPTVGGVLNQNFRTVCPMPTA